MNWLLVVVLVILFFHVVRGFQKGFLRVLLSLVSFFIVIALVGAATPHISSFIKDHTGVYRSLSGYFQEKMADATDAAADSVLDQQKNSLDELGISLPSSLTSTIFDQSKNGTSDIIAETGIYDQLGDQIASIIIGIAAFVIALILALIIVGLIGKATDLVNKIPILKGINRFFGIWAGLLQGLLIVWMLFLLITVITSAGAAKELLVSINGNPLLSALYDHNPLLTIISTVLS